MLGSMCSAGSAVHIMRTFLSTAENCSRTVFLLLVLSITMATESDRKALEAVAKGNMAFTANLYKLLRETEGNVFFSPISIEVILALAYTGARGDTAEQMAAALQLPKDRSTLQAGFHSLMLSLKSTDSMTLEIANRIFGQKSFPFEADFKTVAEKYFLSAAQEMNFAKEPEASRKIINQWVEERTRNKIRDLIPEGLIDSMTRMVLVNAIYFKGKWKSQFDADNTYPQPFHLSKRESKEVPMMHIKKKFGYAEREDLQAKVLVMPYVGDQISMVILLPDAIDGLDDLESKLDKIDMADILQSVENVEVEVTLPRFKLETTIDLNDPLKRLGMTDMFDEEAADFSGISKVEGLFVSKVLQKAFIEVNEEGSEAAAATAVVIAMRMELWPDPVFIADHPFLFVVFDYASNSPLFFGRLTTPQS
ncbi:leukocyte elastase inhibitor isoform X4 [Anabrus simplex]|uniref:leukocyte elastase inhibitor isoform X4 n=1 Tax=Anabrus simplex TaxID=316456 RepID=UPI0034DDAACF